LAAIKLLLRQLPGQFRTLEARQEVDITWRAANVGFLGALRFVRTKKLRPLRLQLSHRLLLIGTRFLFRSAGAQVDAWVLSRRHPRAISTSVRRPPPS
jgi:hypothetical protein